MKLLEIKNVKKSFGAVDVLHDISLSVAQRSSVDLPEPEGPIIATTSPCSTESEIS